MPAFAPEKQWYSRTDLAVVVGRSRRELIRRENQSDLYKPAQDDGRCKLFPRAQVALILDVLTGRATLPAAEKTWREKSERVALTALNNFDDHVAAQALEKKLASNETRSATRKTRKAGAA